MGKNNFLQVLVKRGVKKIDIFKLSPDSEISARNPEWADMENRQAPKFQDVRAQ
jgi:hypothetical protein